MISTGSTRILRVIFKRVLYKDEHQKNWRELIDLVHEVNRQSIIWLDIEHPKTTKQLYRLKRYCEKEMNEFAE